MTAAPPTEAALPRPVLEAAGAYRLYMRRAAEQSDAFTNGAAIAQALRSGAAFEPKQLGRGATAYAALVALQDDRFVSAVRRTGAADREGLMAALTANPNAALALEGGESAASAASAVLAQQGARVRAAGQRVKQAAYDVQRQPWSKLEVSGRIERLAAVKTLSAAPLSPPEAELAALATFTADERAPQGAADVLNARPIVARGLAVAALAVLGADAEAMEPLLSEPGCDSCLRMSKLNLFQCLAVAKPWYEDVFCLGQHVLIDTGDCIKAAATPKAPAAFVLAPARREEAESAPTTVAALH